MKDIQEYINVVKNNVCVLAVIYYINTKYVCKDGNVIVSDNDLFYSTKEKAEHAMNYDIEHSAIPYGIESVERSIEHKIIEINI